MKFNFISTLGLPNAFDTHLLLYFLSLRVGLMTTIILNRFHLIIHYFLSHIAMLRSAKTNLSPFSSYKIVVLFLFFFWLSLTLPQNCYIRFSSIKGCSIYCCWKRVRNGGKFFQISGIDKFPFVFAGKKKLIWQITDDFHDYLRQSNGSPFGPQKGLACRTDLRPFTVP